MNANVNPVSLNHSIAQLVTQGQWMNGEPKTFGSLNFDSRLIQDGETFIALQANRDGHNFVIDAKNKGASCAIVSRVVDCELPQLLVKDPLTALADLAHWWRAFHQGDLVLVTGSAGKSTTKEMIYSIFKSFVGSKASFASDRNYNNLIGLPLMLLRINANHSYAVLEAGMNAHGEISKLTRVARPTLGLITNAGRAHLGNFANQEEIALAKGEIIGVMSSGNTIVLNADDKYFPLWRSMASHLDVISFSHSGKKNAVCRKIHDRDFVYTFEGSVNHHEISLQVPGIHNEQNALAAATVAWRLGIPQQHIKEGLEEFSGVPGRQEINVNKGLVVINDSYNASPESFDAALYSLKSRPEKNKFLIMGDMLELGAEAHQLHVDVIKKALDYGVDDVLVYGEFSANAAKEVGGHAYKNKKSLINAAMKLSRDNCAVLIKGSNAMGMNEVAVELLKT